MKGFTLIKKFFLKNEFFLLVKKLVNFVKTRRPYEAPLLIKLLILNKFFGEKMNNFIQINKPRFILYGITKKLL